MSQLDLTFVDKTISDIGTERDKLIPLLQSIQQHYRYLPTEALERLSDKTGITPEAIAGVSTFYTQFRHEPVGTHMISVCNGTACHVKGADAVYDALRRHLKLDTGKDTDSKGLFTLEKVACLGCCTLAPAVQIGDVTYGHLTADGVEKMLDDYLQYVKHHKPSKDKAASGQAKETIGEIRLGLGSCCVARGSGKLYEAFKDALSETDAVATVKKVGCVGMCHQTPLVEVVVPGQKPSLYAQVNPEDARGIILRHFKPRGLQNKIKTFFSRTVDSLLTDSAWQSVGQRSIDVREKPVAAFLDKQKHIATERCGVLDPTDLEEYRQGGGFKALEKCVTSMDPDEVISEIRDSHLRGRGGAGFPSGIKWQAVRDAQGDKKYIVCNGDEGDPGAFMDRMLLESYPYRIIEGLAIAAYAVGANEGYFYIRAEYPLAIKQVTHALEQCEKNNLIGESMFGSDFSLKLKIKEGAGAFVCGEETALIASIEGYRGMPRLRPPFPAQSGLWNKPTLVNNVETYALVPWILNNGSEAFSQLGTEKSKGTKVFALAGKIARGGLIEVPMGISLREIVEKIGGGVADGKRFKAVQVGGPSGGCVPAEQAHVAVDYEELTAAGAIMGSGGLVVLDDSDCMVDIARYFLEFTQDQSCGKCTFCRVGTKRMLDILERLCKGEGKNGDLEELEQLAVMVQKGSLCGLGRTAPNPVLSTLKNYREEYQAHIDGTCPAGKCKALITYEITDECIGCTICAQGCPVEAIAADTFQKHTINNDLCVRCGGCKTNCPIDAIIVK